MFLMVFLFRFMILMGGREEKEHKEDLKKSMEKPKARSHRLELLNTEEVPSLKEILFFMMCIRQKNYIAERVKAYDLT